MSDTLDEDVDDGVEDGVEEEEHSVFPDFYSRSAMYVRPGCIFKAEGILPPKLHIWELFFFWAMQAERHQNSW